MLRKRSINVAVQSRLEGNILKLRLVDDEGMPMGDWTASDDPRGLRMSRLDGWTAFVQELQTEEINRIYKLLHGVCWVGLGMASTILIHLFAPH